MEQILSSVGDAKSPVTGESFDALSAGYKKKKKDEGAGTKANLEFSGEMLDAIGFKETKEGIKVGVFGKQAPKADGHNNLSGKSQLPERQFLPKEGEGFKGSIESGIESIIAENLSELPFPQDKFEDIESKAELYAALSEVLAIESKAEIRSAVLMNEEWRDALDEMDLLRWL